jgi:RNA polymerase sigma-70 factor (ECF subfamily)
VLAEDATQDAFVRVSRARSLTRRNRLRQVVGIARNHCIDLLRRRRHGELRLGDEAAERSGGGRVCRGVDALVINERSGKVRAALAALPEKYRLPIVLAYYNDASYDEIAEALGISRNHVGVLLLRGKQTLRKALAPSRRTPSDAPIRTGACDAC